MSDFSSRLEAFDHSASSAALTDDDLSSPDDLNGPPLREGLPASYRMRADAHYVDALDAPPASPWQRVAVHAIDGDEGRSAPPAALVESIRRHGVLEPLLVQKCERRFRLIAGRQRLAAARAAGQPEVPCIVHRISDAEAQRLSDALGRTAPVAPEGVAAGEPSSGHQMQPDFPERTVEDALAAVLSCASLLTDAQRGLTETVTLDMIRAEAHRALCAVSALRVVRRGVAPAVRTSAPRDIVAGVADRVRADALLRGIVVETAAPVPDRATVAADAEVIASALAGVVLMMTAALDRRQVRGAALTLTAITEGSDRVTVAAVQDAVIMPEAWLALASGPAAGSPAAPELTPLLALRLVAEAYGGRLVATRLPHGSRVAVELPLGSGR